MPNFHCGPFKKEKEKKGKRRERLGGSKTFIRLGLKGKMPKKIVRYDW